MTFHVEKAAERADIIAYLKDSSAKVNLYRRNAINQVETKRFQYGRTTSR
jgi:hypothetical protein